MLAQPRLGSVEVFRLIDLEKEDTLPSAPAFGIMHGADIGGNYRPAFSALMNSSTSSASQYVFAPIFTLVGHSLLLLVLAASNCEVSHRADEDRRGRSGLDLSFNLWLLVSGGPSSGEPFNYFDSGVSSQGVLGGETSIDSLPSPKWSIISLTNPQSSLSSGFPSYFSTNESWTAPIRR